MVTLADLVPAKRPRRSLATWLAMAIVLMMAGAAWAYFFYYPSLYGPAQPISFSHRVHVTDKQISCFLCHTGATETARAGVPAVETCMLCHSRVIVEHPEIRKLREYYDSGKPVPWARVNDVPDFTFFNHQAHVRRGFDCGRCHGDVAHMDRVTLTEDLKMGFCVQCHRDNNYSHDCYVCHR